MSTSNNSVKVKGIPLEIGGTTFIVPPLPLGALEHLLPRINNYQKSSSMSMDDVQVVIDSAHAALKRNYPDMERDFVADSIGLENMQEIMEAVMDVSGLKRKQIEASAAGEA